VLNAGAQESGFVTPGAPGQRFTLLVDTRSADGRPAPGWTAEAGSGLVVPAHSVLVASGPRPGR